MGGTSFQNMGLVAEYDTPNKAQGVAGLSGKGADRMTFKVPILPPSTNDTPKLKLFG